MTDKTNKITSHRRKSKSLILQTIAIVASCAVTLQGAIAQENPSIIAFNAPAGEAYVGKFITGIKKTTEQNNFDVEVFENQDQQVQQQVIAAGEVQAQNCGEVEITEMDWASASVVTGVAKFLMENGYGCDVTKVPSNSTAALASVTENNKPDILTELWILGAPSYPELEAAGKIVPLTPVLSDGGVEGWWLPQYTVDAHPELATLEGVLAHPELLGGLFHQCPEGWYCKVVNKNLIKATGLENSEIEVFEHGSGETLAASIAAAYAEKEPWFGYYWAPTAILGKYPMVQVDLGEYNAEIHFCNAKNDCDDPKVSPYPSSRVLTVVTSDFAKSHPAVTDMMRNLSFTNKKMGELLAWKEDNNASSEETAVYFLTNNSDIWSNWLNNAARKKLSALIK